jgi:aryl-alcohol dehydrogenase-like predicted oxidoreductase
MTDLPTSLLGTTSLTVTKLGYGAMELRGGPTRDPVSPSDADRLLNAVLDEGINFVDTSPDYGDSEVHIGRAISHRRDEYFLASKCGCPLEYPPDAPRPLAHDYSRANIVAAVERSLDRLRTDHLDLLQLHISPSRETLEREDAIATLHMLRDQGKVRFLGSSSTLPNLVDHIEMGAFDEFQIPYSALEREHEDIITKAASMGAGVVVRGGVARGTRTGTGTAARWARWDAANLDDLLGGMSVMEFMLRFTISHPAMTTTIVGTANPSHLADNAAAARKGELDAALYFEAKRRLSATPGPTATSS